MLKNILGATYSHAEEPKEVNEKWKIVFSITRQYEEKEERMMSEEADVLIGGDGARGVVADSFQFQKRREGGRNRMIGVTCNFVNRQSREEMLLREFSLVSYLNQSKFRLLEETHGIALENLVFFRDQHFYFVMTPKIQSLVSRGVLKSGEGTAETLLDPPNVCREQLEALGRDVAQFCGVPADNDYLRMGNRPDIEIFDFSTKTSCAQQCKIALPSATSFSSSPLFVGIVGDALIEPFWPMGTGTNRALQSALDVVWLTSLYFARGSGEEREEMKERVERAGVEILRVLLTLDEPLLHRPHNGHMHDPRTRYLQLPRSYLGNLTSS